MRISHFFIDRPIFAAVLSIVFVILGGVAFSRLPIAQYPEIAPPTINITGHYPGATAEVVAATVATPIEQEINGVEDMLYMSSQSDGDGRLSLDPGHVRARHRSRQGAGAGAEPRRDRGAAAAGGGPRIGVTVRKASPDLMMVVHLLSPDESLRPALHLQLRDAQRDATSSRASTASATITVFGAAITRCGSGSIRTACRRSA